MDGPAPLRPAIALALVAALAEAVYVFAGIAPSASIQFGLSTIPFLAVLDWLRRDARRTRLVPVQDWALQLMFAWPVLIPWYLAKTRGRAGWRAAVALFAIVFAGPLAALVGSIEIARPGEDDRLALQRPRRSPV